jgi:inosose dehydratase
METTDNIARRDMLRLGMVAGCMGVAGCSGDDGYGVFRMSLTSYSFREFTAAEAVAKVAALGISCIDLWPSHVSSLGGGKRDRSAKPYHENPQAWAQFQKSLQQHSVECVSYGVQNFMNDHDANRRIFDWAQQEGFQTFMANPSLDAFDSLERLVEEYDLTVGVHNHGPEDPLFGKLSQMLEALKDRHPKIGVCADLGHFFRSGDDPIEALEQLQGRLYGIHIKDVVRDVEFSKARVVIGKGEMNIPVILKKLRSIGYDGYLTYEHENHWDNPSPHIAESLVQLKQMCSKLE